MSGMVESCHNANESAEFTATNNTTATGDTDVPVVPKKSYLYLFFKMVLDFLFIGFFLSSVLSYVENSNQPLIRAARKPEPFFAENSTVRDYWSGKVFSGFQDAAYYESSFFFFYAAWDRESQEARAEMELVGQFFSESDVLIAAVNCWYPTSDCAKEFGGKSGAGNILPVFIFYPKLLNGIQYRGQTSAQHIISFVQRSRYPVKHIRSIQHFKQLQVEYDSVLLGYLPNTNSYSLDINHQELQKTALSLVELQQEQYTSVGVVTSQSLAKQMQLHTSQPTKLYNHNSTHTYPNKTIDSEKLASWALKRTVVPASWLNLPSRKSHVLKRVLEGGSGNVLLLFGPRIKLGKDPLYKLLRQVAIEYQNCDETKSSDSLVDRLKQPGQTESFKDSFKLSSSSSSFCQLRSWSYDSLEDAFPACTLPSSASNSTTCLNRFRMRSSLQGYDPHVQLMLEENASEKRKVKMLVEEMHIGGLMEDGEEALDVFGLGCRSNKTLRMYRVDSSSSVSLLNSLGLEGQSLPFPVILNLAEESLHLPSANFRMQHAEEDLKRFLVSWHTGELAGKPGFRSTDHGSNVRFEPNSETDNSDTVSVITEISASKFSSDIIPHKDVVLFYTSSFCTFCSTAAYAFHTVKMYLDSVPSIRFLMIDATKNDLSWEFTALSYPSVIFFPRNRHDMSRVYPTEENLNVTNLLSFVIWNLTPSDRLQLALNHCDYTCRQQVRLAASLRVNQLSSELRRNGSKVPLNSKLQISRRLKYAKSVLYVLSSLENATVQPQMHNRYFTAIMERMLSGNP